MARAASAVALFVLFGIWQLTGMLTVFIFTLTNTFSGAWQALSRDKDSGSVTPA